MLKFWSAVKQVVLKKERDSWLKLYGFDNRCPHCEVWQGNCGGVKDVKRDCPDTYHDAYKCGNCSKWFIMRADTPIQTVAENQVRALDITVDEMLLQINDALHKQQGVPPRA